jgi:hypothetical protein
MRDIADGRSSPDDWTVVDERFVDGHGEDSSGSGETGKESGRMG